MTAVISAVAAVLALLLAGASVLFWRLYQDSTRRTDTAMELVNAERARFDQQQAALHRYEVAFSSIHGRGELGERVLIETARALGLREDLHFTVQADLAGGGTVRPDLVLLVGGGRRVPVDAKMSLACWAEAVETDDDDERRDALRVHVRNIRSRATELAGKGYQRWADAIYGTVMFVPSDAAVIAALDTDPELFRWLLDRRVFLCGPTGFAVLASAAMFAATDRAIAEDVEQVRSEAAAAHRSAGGAIDAFNLSSTHLQRFIAARRRELDALETFRGTVQPLTDASASPTPLAAIRRQDNGAEAAAGSQPAILD